MKTNIAIADVKNAMNNVVCRVLFIPLEYITGFENEQNT